MRPGPPGFLESRLCIAVVGGVRAGGDLYAVPATTVPAGPKPWTGWGGAGRQLTFTGYDDVLNLPLPGGDRLLPRQGGAARPKSGPSPVDRAQPGSKHHVLTDGQGIPLAASLTSGNRNDVTRLLPLLDRVPAVARFVGRPRRRPDALLADRGYDHDKYRRLLWQRGIRPVIAERGR